RYDCKRLHLPILLAHPYKILYGLPVSDFLAEGDNGARDATYAGSGQETRRKLAARIRLAQAYPVQRLFGR
ncbi:hypothetical protein C1631_023580, partial [Chryseobacterium phosphatilyticum]